MSLNDGHRERLRRRFRSEGLDNFEPHEVLELLLFYVIPRGNVNHIGHRLISHFGSLSGVFNAKYEELMTVEGVGEQAALSLVEERKNGEFLSQEDIVVRCPRVSQSVVDLLAQIGALDGLAKSTQVSLF